MSVSRGIRLHFGLSKKCLCNQNLIQSTQRFHNSNISNINDNNSNIINNNINSFDNVNTNNTNSSEEYLNIISDICKEYIPDKLPSLVWARERFHNQTIFNENGDIDTEWQTALAPEDMTFSKILPIHSAQNLIDLLHDYMPYWGALMLVPFLTKLVYIMPVQILSQKKQEKIMPYLPSAMQEYRAAAAKYKNDKKKWEMVSGKLREKYGFNPLSASFRPLIAVVLQMPVHFTLFIASKTMYSSYPDWKYGGVLWFENLAIQDPTWILPTCVSLSMGLTYVVNMRLQQNNPDAANPLGVPREMINVGMGVLCVFTVPMSHMFTAGFNLYMVANLVSFACQTAILQNDTCRSIVGLKPTSYQSQYQKELKQVNTAFNARAKEDIVGGNVEYRPIQGKSQRRTMRKKDSVKSN